MTRQICTGRRIGLLTQPGMKRGLPPSPNPWSTAAHGGSPVRSPGRAHLPATGRAPLRGVLLLATYGLFIMATLAAGRSL